MGLDARVFLRRESLPERLRAMDLTHDPETGEWCPPESVSSPLDERSVHERLGNVATTAHLRSVLEKLAGQTATLRLLLANGSAAGVVFPVDEAARMEAEALALEKRGLDDPHVINFIAQIKTLAAASRREGNSIVI